MQQKIHQLDAVRGLAILLVIAHNTSAKYPSLHLQRFFGNGWMGVDLFFVLSGFLITGILADTKDSVGYFTRFYARRCLRIWPLLFPDFFHVRGRSVAASLGRPHRLRKIVALVGLSLVPPELPGSELNWGNGPPWCHVVARHRGTVLSGLALGRAILLSCSGPVHCPRGHLSFSRAAFVLVTPSG